MSNLASVTQIQGSIYGLYVNGNYIYGATQSEVNQIKIRLNYIFQDLNRDLDFITPSFINGNYVVCCPLVRKNVNQVTYFDSKNSSGAWQSYPEKLYEPTIWNDTNNINQTAIMIVNGAFPWVEALQLANAIRQSVNPNFASANGKNPLADLVVPTNQSDIPASIISNGTISAFYGHPCQGTDQGATSNACPGYNDLTTYQNISSASTSNGEVFHPAGLTCALTISNNWAVNYKNKFIRVTNISNGLSIIVRVTDTAPANMGVELSYRAWVEIGKPLGAGTLKVELMAT